MTLTAEEKRWQSAVHSLETCSRCGRHGIQWAHRNEGKGMGLKVSPDQSAALCIPCHTALDQYRDMTREESRAEMDRAIVITHHRLYQAGKLRLVK